MPVTPQKTEEMLVWKPSTFWVALFFFVWGVVALGVFLFHPNKSFSDWFFALAYVFWTIGALFSTLYSWRARVQAGESGMRWRDWRGTWHAAKWDEIRDFYFLSRKQSTHTIETAHGNFTFTADGDGKAIAEIISVRATNAPTRQWEIKGERLEDEWPRRFEFFDRSRETIAKIAFLVLLASFGYVAWWLFRLPPRADLQPGVWFMAYVGPILLLPVLPALTWLFLFVGVRQARPFRGQSVEISPQGLVFNGAARIELLWAQIETWRWKKRGARRFLELQGTNQTLEIPLFGFGNQSFYRIIERFSGVPLMRMAWEEITIYPLPPSTNETLIFDFNSAVSRLLSQVLLPMSGMIFLMPFLMRFADPLSPPRDEASVVAMGVMLIGLSMGWLWFLRIACLRLTADALEWHAPLFHRTVAWHDIESFGSTPSNSGWISVAGKQTTLSMLGLPPSQRSRLQAEIEKRAFNATGEWK